MLGKIPAPEFIEPMPNPANKNCISFWLPRIEDRVPTPRTSLIRIEPIRWTDSYLSLCDGGFPEAVTVVADWVKRVGEGSGRSGREGLGFPLFLRTGLTSGKHSFEHTCFVRSADIMEIERCVAGLVEFSAMAGFVGLEVGVWAARQYLSVEPVFRCTAYGNMPVITERRYFVRGGELLYSIPYWPEGALLDGKPDREDWRSLLPIVQQEFSEKAAQMAIKCGEACGGDWSVDVLLTRDGYFVTDMAIAQESWGWRAETADKV